MSVTKMSYRCSPCRGCLACRNREGSDIDYQKQEYNISVEYKYSKRT